MLIPPLNWCLVERGLSRSGVPSRINLEFLARQKLKTIVVLAHPDQEDDEDPTANMEQQVLSYIAANNIQLIQLGGAAKDPTEIAGTNGGANGTAGIPGVDTAATPLQPTNARGFKHLLAASSKPTSEDLVIAALNLVLDPKTYPLHLICSSNGRHRTGVVIGCFRKLQRWALSSIFAEYRRYAGGERGMSDANNEMMMNEQFIELFDIDLVSHVLAERHVQKHLRMLNIQSQSTATSAASSSSASAASSTSGQKDASSSSASSASLSSRGGEGGGGSAGTSTSGLGGGPIKKSQPASASSSRHQTPAPSPTTAHPTDSTLAASFSVVPIPSIASSLQLAVLGAPSFNVSLAAPDAPRAAGPPAGT